ncbi:TolC family protein [Chitinophaga oryziterrae]|uniref:TolC family protein n=1 Tax=Chitinophaga oryziterrae TaxID=1031224 RepID=A0A6N8JB38_9BACT|nr:TolC family protein [Chitinophaga oryziterrae]MVT42373.1 TolC family protein [Chitinophaga oryziterrae]
MKNSFSITAVLLLLSCKALAQDKVTLEVIFQQIQKDNPGLKMYDAEIRSQDEAAKGVHNWEPPEIGGGLWMTPYNPALWKKGQDGTPGMGQFMISAQQMFPNKRKQDAEAKYMEAVSSVDAEKKKASLNELYAMAKKNYYQWIIIKKKLSVIDQNEKLLNFMIQNAEIRYKNGLEKIGAYYKAKAALGNLQNTRLVLENDIKQKQVALNTLMNRDKLTVFDIDTIYQVNDYAAAQLDSTTFINSRSDIKAVEKDIQLTYLQQSAERAKLKPEFGVSYNHMFGFGGQPMQYSLMGTVKIPMAKWSSKTVNANVESLKWKVSSLNQQRQMMVNDVSGAAYNMKNEIALKKKQIKLFDENIIPALKRNFQVMQLAYEQNTEQLFTLYDAWETLNMTQLEYLEQLQQLLLMQAEMERILEIQ